MKLTCCHVLQQAYEILSDPESKRRHDAGGYSGGSYHSHHQVCVHAYVDACAPLTKGLSRASNPTFKSVVHMTIALLWAVPDALCSGLCQMHYAELSVHACSGTEHGNRHGPAGWNTVRFTRVCKTSHAQCYYCLYLIHGVRSMQGHSHQQQEYQAYHAWQQEQWRQAEQRMPSSTTTLTTSNIRQLVFWSSKPWLILVSIPK